MTAASGRVAIAAATTAALMIVLLTGPREPAAESGPEAFAHIYRVATHPRCVNCHGAGSGDDSMPLVGDDGRPHPMNITRRHNPGTPGKPLGVECGSCHGDRNLGERGTPPGAPNGTWQMPHHDEMRLLPLRSAPGLSKEARQAALCRRWRHAVQDMKGKNPDFLGHVVGDPLIRWAFVPTPARQAAPDGHDRFVETVDTWIKWLDRGGSCDELARPAPPAPRPR